MLYKLTEFKHAGGTVIITDPCYDNTHKKHGCLNIEIYQLSKQQCLRNIVELPAGMYICEQDSETLDIRILQKDYDSDYIKCEPSIVATGFSANVCVCDENFIGKSEYFTDYNPNEIQFRAKDMLSYLKNNRISTDTTTMQMLRKYADSPSPFPFASELNDKLLPYVRKIPNTIWSNNVMIQTHMSSNSFIQIPGGLSFKAPVADCTCFTLKDEESCIRGIYLKFNWQ